MPTADKLILFDFFWDAADKHYPGFVNNPVNWDSVKNHYRPEIEAGVSQGRYAGIITKMGFLLQELHSRTWNDSIIITELYPGVPMVVSTYYKTNDTVAYDQGHFGAVLTPTDDDNLLVLRAVDNHPMGLEAGDIVFGYDSMRWNDIYPLLQKIDFPVTTNNLPSVFHQGSSVISAHHKWLASAGLNWHLFDTLDYQKYGSTDTIHAATNLLIDKSYSLFGNEQLPVEGIEFPGSVYDDDFPNLYGLSSVIYDTINNNSIAYVYITHGYYSDITSALLTNAFNDIEKADVDGLILDLRFHPGGSLSAMINPFNRIFNQGFENENFSRRVPGGEHGELESVEVNWPVYNTNYLNKPIALLTGPGTVSLGDYLSCLINMQPMVRSFGKPSNGAFMSSLGHGPNTPGNFEEYLYWDFGYSGWTFSIAPRNFTIYNDGEPEYMIHKGIEVDEEIWFTQEAADQQKDNVVERAIEWITNVAYTQNGWAEQPYSTVGSNITLKADVVNSSLHELQLDGEVFDQAGALSGTVAFTDDGLNGDDVAKDGVWNAVYTSDSEAFFTANLIMTGETKDAALSMPQKIEFTTVPPPEIVISKDSLIVPGENENITVSLKNISTLDIPGVKVDISSVDSTVLFNNTSNIAGYNAGTLSVDEIFDFDLTMKTAESADPGDELLLASECLKTS